MTIAHMVFLFIQPTSTHREVGKRPSTSPPLIGSTLVVGDCSGAFLSGEKCRMLEIALGEGSL